MNTFITKRSAKLKVERGVKRSLVWAKFLELREAGRKSGRVPILMDSSSDSGGLGRWSYVCVPAEEQPEPEDFVGELNRLEFLPREKFSGCESSVDGPSFVGGWVGFLTYDQGLEWMGVKSRHECGLPRKWFKFCDEVYAFQVVDEVADEEGMSEDLCARTNFEVRNFESRLTREEYGLAIEEIHELLKAGETYQVNFAQEFAGKFEGDPFALYMRLFKENPSAMCFYAEDGWQDGGDADGGWALVSNSPERLLSLRVQNAGKRVMRTEPIKGTLGRDENPQALLNDEKSYAELTMIVDLMRNDLGKVAKVGSVKVLEHRALMELSHVWHTYSVIEAELEDGLSAWDLLRAVFPGGSVTGCPKKRTVEIIDRLENFGRGAYCGSAGYISLNGNVDFNIMIRTATVMSGQDGGLARVNFPAGGGIVMDSTAEAEWLECFKKAEAFGNAINVL